MIYNTFGAREFRDANANLGLSHGKEWRGRISRDLVGGRNEGGLFRRPSVSLYCLKSQVPRGPFGIIGPAANMMRARGYVRYHRDRDMKRGTTKGARREEGSHIERHRRASVVLFQVCIRFVFQPIILTKPSVSSLTPFSLSYSLAAPRRSCVQRNTRRCPKTFPRDIKGEPLGQRRRDEMHRTKERRRDRRRRERSPRHGYLSRIIISCY